MGLTDDSSDRPTSGDVDGVVGLTVTVSLVLSDELTIIVTFPSDVAGVDSVVGLSVTDSLLLSDEFTIFVMSSSDACLNFGSSVEILSSGTDLVLSDKFTIFVMSSSDAVDGSSDNLVVKFGSSVEIPAFCTDLTDEVSDGGIDDSNGLLFLDVVSSCEIVGDGGTNP